MIEKKEDINKILTFAKKTLRTDYHGDHYWDELHERQNLIIKMLTAILEKVNKDGPGA